MPVTMCQTSLCDHHVHNLFVPWDVGQPLGDVTKDAEGLLLTAGEHHIQQYGASHRAAGKDVGNTFGKQELMQMLARGGCSVSRLNPSARSVVAARVECSGPVCTTR